MTSFRIRPRFNIQTDQSPADIEYRLRQRLATHPHHCVATIIAGHIVLKIPPAQRHYWSPQLSLNFEGRKHGKTVVSGLYGPNPNVWAMFAFGYATIGILALFVTITGFAKIALHKTAPELWALPVFAALAVAMYLMSQIGQKMGAEETFTIHHFLEEALGEKVPIH